MSNLKNSKISNLENSYNRLICEMIEFSKLIAFYNSTIWKIHILQFEKLSNILSGQIISEK